MKRLLSYILAVLCCAISSLALAENEAPDYSFEVLSTTDMHGRSTTVDVGTGEAADNNMTRVATIVAEERDVYGDRLLVIDNGDSIQGTLVAQYAITERPEEENPMITAMKEIGYDVWVMGNHEFNYKPAQRDAQVRYAMDAGVSVLSANIVLTRDGENIHGEPVEAGATYYDAWTIRTIRFDEDHIVRVAVIGLSNAANATWDLETNYPDLQFSSIENPEGLLAWEINKQVSYIRDNDLADIVIVSAHSGKGTDDGVIVDFSLEAQAVTAVKDIRGVDLLIYGHDHAQNKEQVTDADGKPVWIVNGGGTSVTKTRFTVQFDENGRFSGCTSSQDMAVLSDTEDDPALAEKLDIWYEDTLTWASSPLAVFGGGWDACYSRTAGKTNTELLFVQTELNDFIHKGMIYSSWQNYASDGIEGAVVSLSTPLFAKNADDTIVFTPKDGDTISTLELSLLYRYGNNLLVTVDMTGEQLYAWMSSIADRMAIDADGKPTLAEGASIYGMDTVYGVDYTYDLTRPVGERVTEATIHGEDIRDMNTIRIVLNSYRLSGGYGFFEVTGLTEADCCWMASTWLGEDRAGVSSQLGEYVSSLGTVTPDDPVCHGQDSSWKIVTE